MRTTIALMTLVLVVAGCSRPASESEPAAKQPEPATAAVVEPEVSIYAAAVANPNRPEDDLASDAGRNPEAVLEFFGIEPGDVVLEMWAGGQPEAAKSPILGIARAGGVDKRVAPPSR